MQNTTGQSVDPAVIERRFACEHPFDGLIIRSASLEGLEEVQIRVECGRCGASVVDCCPLEMIVSGHVVPSDWPADRPIGGIDQSVAFARCCLWCGEWTLEEDEFERADEQLCEGCGGPGEQDTEA